MKDVLISITGSQHSPGETPVLNEDNTIQLVTDGRYQFGEGSCWLSYKESPKAFRADPKPQVLGGI